MMSRSGLVSVALLLAGWSGCTVDWSIDPTAEDFEGKGGRASTGGGGTGGGGTGGATCALEECPAPPNECQVATCVGAQCGVADKPDDTPCGVDSTLMCAGGACKCTSASQCTPVDCYDAACMGGCEYTLNTTLTCGTDGTGSCGADGLCGLCGDRVQNGAEAGVDCGPATQCGACPGEPCTMNDTCASGSCQDGVCCNVACDGKCMGCTMTLTGLADGVCGPLELGKNDPDSSACDSEGGCGAEPGFCRCEDGQTNGNETGTDCGGSTCKACTPGQTCTTNSDCASNKCADGVCCATDCGGVDCAACNDAEHPGICSPHLVDVDGDCSDTQECTASFSCEKKNGESCSSSSDCASGLCHDDNCVACDMANTCSSSKTCVGGSCVDKDLAKGEQCFDNAQCVSGQCVDGVCCESQCAGVCMACASGYTGQSNGDCRAIVAGYDPQNECQGPGALATCSGQAPDAAGDSSCGTN